MAVALWFGFIALLVIIGGVLALVTGIGPTAAAALFVISLAIAVIGAATRSAVVWLGLVAASVFGGMLLFAFLGAG